MKLVYDLKTGKLGKFGENIEDSNVVIITEYILQYILTNNVRLDITKVQVGQNITITDVFIPIETMPHPKTEIEILQENQILIKNALDSLIFGGGL